MTFRAFRISRPGPVRPRLQLIVGSLVVVLTCVLLVASSSLFAPAEESEWQAARKAAGGAEEVASPPDIDFGGAGQAFYPYSVVPGGVHSAEALAAAVEDPLVAEHYASIDIAHARVATVPAPRQVYVSYRVGNRLYWTSHKLALHAGEQVLTDGLNEIRARCGNRISDTPQQPTLAKEPDVAEFDRAVPMLPGRTLASALPNALALQTDGLPLDISSFPAERTFSGPLDEQPRTASVAPTPAPLGAVPVVTHDPITTTSGDTPPPGPPGPTPVPEPDAVLLVITGVTAAATHAWRRQRRR
jgi:hypothetical protein